MKSYLLWIAYDLICVKFDKSCPKINKNVDNEHKVHTEIEDE